jgi:hypothetical protein
MSARIADDFPAILARLKEINGAPQGFHTPIIADSAEMFSRFCRQIDPAFDKIGNYQVDDMTHDLDSSRIANVTTEPDRQEEIEITPEMIEAGEDVILGVVGQADLGALFSASDLALRVFLAMADCRRSSRAILHK